MSASCLDECTIPKSSAYMRKDKEKRGTSPPFTSDRTVKRECRRKVKHEQKLLRLLARSAIFYSASCLSSSSHAASAIGWAGGAKSPPLGLVEQPPRLEVALQLVVPGRHLTTKEMFEIKYVLDSVRSGIRTFRI